MGIVKKIKKDSETIKPQEVITYPEGVVDFEAYRTYLSYKKRIDNPKYRFIDTSDEEIMVDLATPVHIIERKIQYLPSEERKTILEQCKAYRVISGKTSIWKLRAFKIPAKQLREAQILDIRSSEVFEMFARMYSIDEIHRIINQEWEIPLEKGALEAFRRIHLVEIREKQIEKNRSWDGVRLGWKRSRLEELALLYEDRKSKYLTTRKSEDYKLLLQTIEQIRKEVEGDKITIDGDITNRVEEVINRHINFEVMAKMNILQIILSRVSFTQKVNPLYLLYRLQTSYYAKHTGFGGKIEENMPVQHPSKLVYDFDDLERKNREIEYQDTLMKEKLEADVKVLPTENATLDKFQKDLLDKIKKKRLEVNQAQFQVDQEDESRSSKDKIKADKEWQKLVKRASKKDGDKLSE